MSRGKKAELTDLEKRVALAIEGDVGVDRDIFEQIAARAGTDEAAVRSVIESLRRRGVLRRFGAVLRHQKAGFTENVLVVWAVPESKIEEAGAFAARCPEVTHCYERTPPLEGRYNLFTMVHGGVVPLAEIIDKLSSGIGVTDYLVLESEEEFKKASMIYFKGFVKSPEYPSPRKGEE